MTYLPINRHGLIGDLHTAALIGDDGRLVWLPWPRFDSPSLFAALLDDERGGDWLLAPADFTASDQSYDGETAILLTEFQTPTGRAELRDWMTPWDGTAPGHDLCRVLHCTEGEITVLSRFAPRPDYARTTPVLCPQSEGVCFETQEMKLCLASDQEWEVGDGVATFRTTLRAGAEVRCVLSSHLFMPLNTIAVNLEGTRHFWNAWIAKCTYDGLWPVAVRRSAITLKLLTYAPTGAIIAAPTTSLPEWIGGVRNWDYRYTWLRDASLTLSALYILGYRDEARAFFGWLGECAQLYGTPLQIMYGVDGEVDLQEVELDHLEGYRGSRPVRTGNGAYDQRQLDVYGGLLDAAYVYECEGQLLTPEQWATLCSEIDYVCANWSEPDHGIWEMRKPEQHHTFSKLMCWVALDRGIRVATMEGWLYDELHWNQTRDAIRAGILAHSWKPESQAFTMTNRTCDLDASVLLLPLVGFLPADDPRVRSTIEQIDQHLGQGALVYRYRMDDGLPGDEGAFLLCSFWMVEALAMLGRVDEAVQRFTELLACAGTQGLLSEEVDPANGTALGNYPQAFSHIGLINSAARLTYVLRQRDGQT